MIFGEESDTNCKYDHISFSNSVIVALLVFILLQSFSLTVYGHNISFRDNVYKAGLPDVPGFIFRNVDGSPDGFPAEILANLAKDEGVKLEWVDGSWPELLDKLKNKEIDILPGTQITEERVEYLDFLSNTLYTMWSELYIRKEDKKDFNISALSGKKIGMVRDDNNGLGFQKYIKRFDVNYSLMYYKGHDELYDALEKGKIFAATGPRLLFREKLHKHGLVSSGMYFNPTDLNIAFAKGENVQLREAFDQRMELYKADGGSVYNKLYIEHGLAKVRQPEYDISEYLIYVLASFVFLGIVSLIFILVLKYQVNARTNALLAKEQELTSAHNEMKSYSVNLERKVDERTELLKQKNDELEYSLAELKRAQGQLILSEKMAVLGNLVAGIAHEINSPLSAISSSCGVININIISIMNDIDKIHTWFTGPYGEIVKNTFNHVISSTSFSDQFSTREERIAKAFLADNLIKNMVSDAKDKAAILVDLGVHGDWQDYIEFLKDNNSYEILKGITRIADMLRSCSMIELAVGKASRTVRALKSYMYNTASQTGEFQQGPLDIREGLDTVLLLFHNKIKHGVKLEKNYNTSLKVLGNSDEFNQVWTNLIQNSLQAMDDKGHLIIDIYNDGDEVVVKIKDSGCGMSPSVLERVFEPLFTTKKPGEGTGLGMDIVKRIVEKHNGRIDLESVVDKGTIATVSFPVCN